MALIGTLRNKMGTWVVVFVFVAIAAFTLNDLLGNNSVLFGSDEVGEIAGSTISQEEYRDAIQEREVAFRLYANRAPSERDNTLIQEQAWELLISRHAIDKQYEELGVQVTPEEKEDMIWGKNIDEGLKSTPVFQDENGEFDKTRLVQYLQYISQLSDDKMEKFRWKAFERDLAPGRRRIKYENLLIKTTYVTTAEAEMEYHMQSDIAEVKYLFVPYYAVSDSTATVNDGEMKDYYNDHKEKYKTKHVADLSYVTFPVVASASDTAKIVEDMKELARDFQTSQNDSLFAISNSENAETAFTRYTPNTLPAYVNPDSLITGKVYGPFLDNNTYKVVKISSAGKDSVFTARAKHILITWKDTTASEKLLARAKAQNILNKLQTGADFGMEARTESKDPGSANKGGDLGWFKRGDMVPPFDEAVFGATKPGLINHLIETDYGYHIIEVTNAKDNTGYRIGVIEAEIQPSDESINGALRQAESFKASVADLDLKGFKEKASEEGLSVLEAKEVNTSDRRIGVLSNARPVVQWVFRDASVGDVSDVFDLTDQFVVAIKTNELEEGYKPFELVKSEITPLVRKQVKGRTIVDKLKGNEGSLDEMKTLYNDANVYTNSDVKLNTSSLPGIGNDPSTVGMMFSLENGKRSDPFTGENGVSVVELENKTEAPAIADYGLYETQLEQQRRNRTTYSIAEAIKESAHIEDKRYMFY